MCCEGGVYESSEDEGRVVACLTTIMITFRYIPQTCGLEYNANVMQDERPTETYWTIAPGKRGLCCICLDI